MQEKNINTDGAGLKVLLKRVGEWDAPKAMQGEINTMLGTQGKVYPASILSAYMLKKEILRGNLSAIRLEAMLTAEYRGYNNMGKDTDTMTAEELEHHNYAHDFWYDYNKHMARRARDERKEQLWEQALYEHDLVEEYSHEKDKRIYLLNGEEIEGEPLEELLKSAREKASAYFMDEYKEKQAEAHRVEEIDNTRNWLTRINAMKVPAHLNKEMNQFFDTDIEYTYAYLSIYILKKEIVKGNLTAIRLEGIIDGALSYRGDETEIHCSDEGKDGALDPYEPLYYDPRRWDRDRQMEQLDNVHIVHYYRDGSVVTSGQLKGKSLRQWEEEQAMENENK